MQIFIYQPTPEISGGAFAVRWSELLGYFFIHIFLNGRCPYLIFQRENEADHYQSYANKCPFIHLILRSTLFFMPYASIRDNFR